MDQELQLATGKDGFQPHQTLLPPTAPPRLNSKMLPLIQITGRDFLKPLLSVPPSFTQSKNSNYLIAQENVSRALMTPMRDQSIAGLALRDAHQKMGWYLAVEMLTCTSIIGLKKFSIQHLQGTQADWYRVFHEKDTLIVALMRGGEPMALGMSEAMPLAGFLHAKLPKTSRKITCDLWSISFWSTALSTAVRR